MRIKNSKKIKGYISGRNVGNIHLPSTVSETCPSCNNDVVIDFSGITKNVFNNPKFNEPMKISYNCTNCGNTWKSDERVRIIMKLSKET